MSFRREKNRARLLQLLLITLLIDRLSEDETVALQLARTPFRPGPLGPVRMESSWFVGSVSEGVVVRKRTCRGCIAA